MPTTRSGPGPGNGPVPASRQPAGAGFTLLEMLVVLVLAGALVALAFPNLQRLYGSVARNTERAHILDQLAALGRDAIAYRLAYFLPDPVREDNGLGAASGAEFQPYPLELPEGWRLRVDAPVHVRANGVCLGGAVTLLHRDVPPTRLTLEAPLCRVGSALGGDGAGTAAAEPNHARRPRPGFAAR